LSLDIGIIGSNDFDFTFTGCTANGGVLQKQINLTSMVTQTSGTLTTVLFDSSWADLVSVDIGFDLGSDFEAGVPDNIVVNTVPIPAAAWLFGSALAGLGWLRRKPKV